MPDNDLCTKPYTFREKILQINPITYKIYYDICNQTIIILLELKALVVIAGNQKAKSIDLGKLTRVTIKDNQLCKLRLNSFLI